MPLASPHRSEPLAKYVMEKRPRAAACDQTRVIYPTMQVGDDDDWHLYWTDTSITSDRVMRLSRMQACATSCPPCPPSQCCTTLAPARPLLASRRGPFQRALRPAENQPLLRHAGNLPQEAAGEEHEARPGAPLPRPQRARPRGHGMRRCAAPPSARAAVWGRTSIKSLMHPLLFAGGAAGRI